MALRSVTFVTRKCDTGPRDVVNSGPKWIRAGCQEPRCRNGFCRRSLRGYSAGRAFSRYHSRRLKGPGVVSRACHGGLAQRPAKGDAMVNRGIATTAVALALCFLL